MQRTAPTTLLRDPDMMRARAALMLARRLHGSSYAEIAAEFNVSNDTVERALTLAKRAGLITKFEDDILADLVPLALTQMKAAISGGDTAAALEVLKATQLLLKPLEKPQPKTHDPSVGLTLESYMAQLRGVHVPFPAVLEGELVCPALPASPAAAALGSPAAGAPGDRDQLPHVPPATD